MSEIHTDKETIESGADVIRDLAAFHEKWGPAYTEMNKFAVDLNGIEHHLPSEGACLSFLNEFRTAKNRARIADVQVWKDLQGAKAQANLSLVRLLGSWREEARRIINETLDRLPEMLKDNDLEPEITSKLSKPLTNFLDCLDDETVPTRVAALPNRATILVDNLRQNILCEIQKKQKPPRTPTKPFERVCVADIFLIRRVRSVEEWDPLRDQLDDKVKNILKEGKEVELV